MGVAQAMKKSFAFHPFLFAVYPILYIYQRNMGQVNPSQLLVPIVVTTCLAAILLLITWLLMRNLKKAAMIVSLFVILFFSYRYLSNWLRIDRVLQIKMLPLPRNLLSIFVSFVAPLAMGIWCIHRYRRWLKELTALSNVTSLILLIFLVVGITSHSVRTSASITPLPSDTNTPPPRSVSAGTVDTPDIYYLILDGYGSAATLEHVYNHSNHEFIDALKERGFFVVENGYSNYDFTTKSLSSSLNMDYVHKAVESLNDQRARNLQYRQLVANNRILQFFRSREYTYIQVSTVGNLTEHNPYADLQFGGAMFDDFFLAILQTTLMEKMGTILDAVAKRKAVLFAFDTLASIPQMDEPTFTFAHMMSPHPPYAFHSSGEPYSYVQILMQEAMKRKEVYVEEVKALNEMLLSFVDTALANSKISPIIVLQGDHGPRPFWRGDMGATDPSRDRGYIDETLQILNAYHLPDGGQAALHATITPVNTFRAIISHYFGVTYDPLDDRSHLTVPSGLVDVTDMISRPASGPETPERDTGESQG